MFSFFMEEIMKNQGWREVRARTLAKSYGGKLAIQLLFADDINYTALVVDIEKISILYISM